MDQTRSLRCSVSDFLALVNQTLDFAYPSVDIEGEVASFKINQNKYVFFDLKDDSGTVNCFMTVWQLRMPIENGMKIVVTATPKLTPWGKFSLTVRALRPVGEGSLKKSFELLQAKLEKEGLFAAERKRSIVFPPHKVAVISSTGAAGYGDFIKILNDRWGSVKVDVAHVQVQGADAPKQMIRALEYLNQHDDYDAIAILRGGGSADDLAAFNDEPLVRAVASSRAPIITGIGHEIDTSLVDLAADVRAATPSNAAQLLVPDRHEIMRSVDGSLSRLRPQMQRVVMNLRQTIDDKMISALDHFAHNLQIIDQALDARQKILIQLDPEKALRRGYAIARGTLSVGQQITIETLTKSITAEVTHVSKK